MLCQNCQERPATVRLSQAINGHHQTLELCAHCASHARVGLSAMSLENLLESLFSPRPRGRESLLSRLSPASQRVLNAAAGLAQAWGHEHLSAEFLLLAILQQEAWAPSLLESRQLTADMLEQEIQEGIGRREPANRERVMLSSRLKKALELAQHEAMSREHPYIEPEHLLLGILLENESLAAQVLRARGFEAESLGERLFEGVNPPPVEAAPGVSGRKLPPTLQRYTRDLSALAAHGKLDAVIGRETEINRIMRILSRKTKNNPVLIGEPGVGKTAIAEGLALRIHSGEVPELLQGKQVLALDLGALLAGTKFRGEFEERLKSLMDEMRALQGQIILFIDELHTVVGAGGAEGAIDAANLLKPALARGELQVVGATTLDEYRKHIEKDAALERRFQPVMVAEPSPEEAIEILRGLRDSYEAHHRVKILDEAIVAAVDLSDRYVADRFLPDKAIDLLDEACAMERLGSRTGSDSQKHLEERLARLEKDKLSAVTQERYAEALTLKSELEAVKAELETLNRSLRADKGTSEPVVTAEDIALVVGEWTGIPATRLVKEEMEKLLEMESSLAQRVIGQEEAIKAVSEAVRRARSGLKDPKRPIGSFIFLGPTGVGKTELAKALAEHLFNDEEALLRLDMSEFQEKHTVSRLIGAPPGYVGYEEAGQLTEAVRRKPYSVVLFDEIEKAHPDVFNMLLQILDDGHLTDAKGRTVNFKNTVILMTSNVGAKFLMQKSAPLGFQTGTESSETRDWGHLKETALNALKEQFKPEFLNRVDEIVVFHPLSQGQILQIVDLMLEATRRKLHGQGITLELSQAAKEALAEKGYDPTYGARPLRRSIQRQLETPLGDLLLRGEFNAGDHVRVEVADGKFTFFKAEVEAAARA